MLLYANRGRKYPPTIVNLHEEFFLGWDTGFYFPWLWPPPHPDHRGCNFFIQYKLSELIEGPRRREYSLWHCPYLRFHISYYIKDKISGRYVYDHNQFNNLKDLSNQGYFVYYSTNHIVDKGELFQLSTSNALLNEIPFLDVSMINNNHNKATFTRNSSYFLLHSEPEKTPITKWDKIYSVVKEKEGTMLSEDTKLLGDFILALEKKMDIPDKNGFSADMQKISDLPRELRVISKAIIVSRYLKKYLDLHWYKLWLNFR
jgi:hypothetical protein